MTENKNAEPRQEKDDSKALDSRDTTPEANKAEQLIPIKYNKETKMITVDEASRLAQLGLKFEAVSENYDTLKELAQGENKSIKGYLDGLKAGKNESRRLELLEKCGGDADLAEHIMMLENGNKKENDNGFSELQLYFPNFKSREDLPKQVVESAELNGTLLLDEYLRFCLSERQRVKEAARLQKSAQNSSVGSQMSKSYAVDPEAAEFLKGIWKR